MGQFDMASQIPSDGRSFFVGAVTARATGNAPSGELNAINIIRVRIDISKRNIDSNEYDV